MGAMPLTDLARRLLANVDANRGDYAESMMTVPAEEYRDPERVRPRSRGASSGEARCMVALVGRHPRRRATSPRWRSSTGRSW